MSSTKELKTLEMINDKDSIKTVFVNMVLRDTMNELSLNIFYTKSPDKKNSDEILGIYVTGTLQKIYLSYENSEIGLNPYKIVIKSEVTKKTKIITVDHIKLMTCEPIPAETGKKLSKKKKIIKRG